MVQEQTKNLAKSALMIALIFAATYSIKLPNPATGGYSHMGDCMVFLGVLILGKKQGALAGGLGAALSDLLSGAALWVVPTFVIKYLMAWIMGAIAEHDTLGNWNVSMGAVSGGIFQCIAYTLVKIPLVGSVPAIASIPGILMQTLIGLVIFTAISRLLGNTAILKGGQRYEEV